MGCNEVGVLGRRPTATRILDVGAAFPDFDLEGSDGRRHSRKGVAGKRFVVFFYPKDQTPGCTREACDFTASRAAFRKAGAEVYGVSGGTREAKERFAQSSEIEIPLLADSELLLAKACGVYGEKKNYGKTYLGLFRTTFLIGADGAVERVWKNVKVDGHAADVLAIVKAGAK